MVEGRRFIHEAEERTLTEGLTALSTTFASTVQNVTYASFEQSKENQIYAVAVNVPQETDTDLYFTFRGPSTASWIAFGLGGKGSQMDGALIFVAYLNEEGNNITVSPRLGTGHAQPQYTSTVNVTVMESTHYDADSDGGYFIDFHCTECRSWDGGKYSIDTTDVSASMIWAIGSGDQVKSNALDATIHQHDDPNSGGFTLDLKQATGPGGFPSGADLNGSNGGSGGGPSSLTIGTGFHALFMIGGFLVVLPAGFLALRVFERVWMHWAIQSFGLFLIVCGSVGGIVLSKRNDIVSLTANIAFQSPSLTTAQSPNLTHPHQIIGMLALFLILITWTSGLVGHLHFRRTKLSRVSIPQKAHRILGPGTMSIGLINGILGFQFAGNTHAIIGYIILTTLMLILVSVVMMMKKRRSQRKNAMMTPAAQNFRQGQAESAYVAPQQDEAAVPLRDYRTEYTGSGGDIGTAPPPAYGDAGGYYAPPAGPPHGRT